MPDLSQRHPSTTGVLEWFDAGHLPAGPIRNVSDLVGNTARAVAAELPDDPELTAGLRKMLEAKDCFVRATIRAQRTAEA